MKVLSRTIRVRRDTWAVLERVKAAYAAKLGRKKVSHSRFLEECCRLGEMLLTEGEIYLAAGKLYTDLAEARGAAVMESLKTKKKPEAPFKVILTGTDTEFE